MKRTCYVENSLYIQKKNCVVDPKYVNGKHYLLDIAGIHIQYNNLPAALENFNSVLQEQPKDVVALAGRGCLYAIQNDWTAALEDFNAVLQLEPDNAFALTQRDECLYFVQQFNNCASRFIAYTASNSVLSLNRM